MNNQSNSSSQTVKNIQYSNNIPSEKKSKEYSMMETLFAWLSVIVGICLSRAIPVSEYPFGSMIVTFVLFAFGVAYCVASKKKLKASSIVFMVVVGAFSFGFINVSNNWISGFLSLFVAISFLYWANISIGNGRLLGKGCLVRILKSLFVVPIENLGKIFPAFVIREKGSKAFKNIMLGVVGLLCAIIPTSIVVSLLSYDSEFVSIIRALFYFDFATLFEFILDSILGFFLAMIIYGSLNGAKKNEYKEDVDGEEYSQFKIVSKILTCAAVTPVLFVYVIFFISQWDYYISAFTKKLPENLSYANYAREGFFQLCAVCVFNALMLLLFNVLTKKSEKKYDVVKIIYSSAISVFTLVLVATAMSKMLLYIESYGLTRLRVYSSWMIILLAVFFIIALIHQFVPRLPIISALIVSFVVFFGILIMPDVDSIIANYNVDAYIKGDLVKVDVATISNYDESSVEALFKLYDHLESKSELSSYEERLFKITNNALWGIYSREFSKGDEDGMFQFSIPKYKAGKLYESHDNLSYMDYNDYNISY